MVNFPLPPAPDEFSRLMAFAALFEGDLSVDLAMELTGKKASVILLHFEEGVRQGCLRKKNPGVFFFDTLEKRQKWQSYFTKVEKMKLHRRIAELLMKELPEEDQTPLDIASHLLHIPNDVQKCRWLLKAGDLHFRAYRIEEALKYFIKVTEDLRNVSGEEADFIFTEASLGYSKISTARHNETDVIYVLQEALARAKRRNKKAQQALLEMHLAKSEWLCSQYESALKHFKSGWSMAMELGDPKLLRSATAFSTFFLYWQGRFCEAVRIYEKTKSDVEIFPQGGFPLLAALMVGQCYAYIGQITQGLGMLDALFTQCSKSGNRYIHSEAGIAMGVIMLEIGRIDEALKYLESSVEEAVLAKNEWMRLRGNLALAYAYRGEYEKSMAFLKEFMRLNTNVELTVQNLSYLMELCCTAEQGRFPQIPGLSLQAEIARMIKGENIYMKGVAYRYQSFLEKKEGFPQEKILQSLQISITSLTESGHQVELAKSQIELAHCYLEQGDEVKAKELAQAAARILSPLNDSLIPDDLKSLIQHSREGNFLLNEILRLGQDVVAIRDNKDLIQRILSTANRIAGGERGAIFLLDDSIRPIKIHLRASKNLPPEQIDHPGFFSSMKMITEVAKTGTRCILKMDSSESPDSQDPSIIRSRICIPMMLRDKVVGVLYHDNRLLKNAFKESDMNLLAYFAALAAIALDNAQAYEEISRLNKKLKEEKSYYEEQDLQSLNFEDLIGESPGILRVLAQVEQVAPTDSTVLIRGETGVGKELVARAIHRRSPRRNKPFIRVFCNTLPESLIPSELFGHEKGAFTGAIHQRIGRFELADGGTLFLDEIGDLPTEVQVRLLRVLQSKEFERVGGSKTLHSDFRLVTATNRDLEQEITANRFRQDLYYRLNVFPVYVPPLRERKEDIPLLALYFLNKYSTKIGKKFEGIPEPEMVKLFQYAWPGNVREMENIIERSTILNSGPIFRIPELGAEYYESRYQPKNLSMEETERQHILWVLQKTKWRIKGSGGAAEVLKIHPSTLAFRMKKLKIQRPASLPQKSAGEFILNG